MSVPGFVTLGAGVEGMACELVGGCVVEYPRIDAVGNNMLQGLVDDVDQRQGNAEIRARCHEVCHVAAPGGKSARQSMASVFRRRVVTGRLFRDREQIMQVGDGPQR